VNELIQQIRFDADCLLSALESTQRKRVRFSKGFVRDLIADLRQAANRIVELENTVDEVDKDICKLRDDIMAVLILGKDDD